MRSDESAEETELRESLGLAVSESDPTQACEDVTMTEQHSSPNLTIPVIHPIASSFTVPETPVSVRLPTPAAVAAVVQPPLEVSPVSKPFTPPAAWEKITAQMSVALPPPPPPQEDEEMPNIDLDSDSD